MKKNAAPDYAAVLADLQNRRARLDAAIAALEALEAVEVVVGMAVGRSRSPAAKVAPPKTPATTLPFVGLTVLDAAKCHLQRTGHSLRTMEILGALQQGGAALRGKSPINSLGAILNSNLKKGSAIVRERRGVWALAAWHAPRAEVLNGSRVVELNDLLGAAGSTQLPNGQTGLPAASPSILMHSPATACALHA